MVDSSATKNRLIWVKRWRGFSEGEQQEPQKQQLQYLASKYLTTMLQAGGACKWETDEQRFVNAMKCCQDIWREIYMPSNTNINSIVAEIFFHIYTGIFVSGGL